MTFTDEATQQWSELATHMEALLAAWSTGDPPTLSEFLPHGNLAIQVVALVELIKIDLEQRKSRGLWHPLEWYAEKFPEMLHEGEPPCDLIYEEFHIRKSAGEEVDPQEYFHRFPKNRGALSKLLNYYDVQQTTSLAAGRPSETFEPGDSIDDFDLLTKLGAGAFASVFLARQRSMQRIVALKISADKGVEGQTLAQLEHPHIVRVYDQRRLPERKLRLLYMQYAPGGSLQDVVYRVRRTLPADRTGKLLIDSVEEALDRAGYSAPEPSASRRRLAQASWPETVCRIGIQLAQALDYAHHRGILHRDVKPANVLVSGECTAKLADFNISFSSQLEGASPASYFGGSMAYMSPEQLEACNPEHPRTPESLDARSDLFSLAAMLWELLHGTRPYRDQGLSGNWTAMLEELTKRRHFEKPEPPDNAPRDALTRDITEVLLRVMSVDPQDRPANGSELARDLALCLQPRSKKLLERPRGGLRKWVRSWPLLAAIIVVVVPNLFGAGFNLYFNHNEIQSKLGAFPEVWWILANWPYRWRVWVTLLVVLNSLYFGIAFYLVYYVIGPTARAVRASFLGKSITASEAIDLRRRSLSFGHIAAILGSLIWVTAGLAFPLGIQVFMNETPSYFQFLASMVICGMVSAAYPFFGLTLVATKVYFPALLPFAPGADDDDARLEGLKDQTLPYLFVAGGVPLIGGMIVLAVSYFTGQDRRMELFVLILFGVLGLIALYFAYKQINVAIKDLLAAVHPFDAASSMTESVEAR